jgi:hypothetical protein
MKQLIILTLVILAGCISRKKEDLNISSMPDQKNIIEGFRKTTNVDFGKYLENFSQTSLPITIKEWTMDATGLKEMAEDSFNPYNDLYCYAFKQIPTNGDYIATIRLGIADSYVPILTTYDLNGNKIDNETLSVGYCGADCGFECEAYLIIKDNYTILASDTIISSECDSLGNIIPNTTEHYVMYQEGEILRNGEIVLSEEIRKILE